MKSTFLCIVTLITCSGCVIGDLEFYPDYQRSEVPEEEWVKDQPLNPEIQNFLDEQRSALYQQQRPGLPYEDLQGAKQEDLAWPSIFKNQNLARRISELTRNLEESSRKPQYYFKTHGLNREQESRLNAYNTFEDRNTGDFVPRFKPNFHILDDVRLNPNADNSDFSLPNDDLNAVNEPSGRQPLEDQQNGRQSFEDQQNSRQPLEDQQSGRQSIERQQNGQTLEDQQNRKQMLVDEQNVQFDDGADGEFEEKSSQSQMAKDAKLVDDPTEFAYPPSDPRYFEDSLPTDLKSTRFEDNKFEDNKFEDNRFERGDLQKNADPIEIHNRNEEGYYHHQSLTDLRDASRHPDDSLEVVAVKPHPNDDTTGVYIIAIVAGISAAATVGLIAFGIGWYNLQKHVKNASDVEYPAYGVTGPNKDISPSGDRRLAQSAQMYHYQHQKQQIIAMESRAAASERHGSVSEADSDEENEEGDYTVYECPGLAPTGEMEVKNPLFQDDPTPAQTPAMKPSEEVVQKQ